VFGFNFQEDGLNWPKEETLMLEIQSRQNYSNDSGGYLDIVPPAEAMFKHARIAVPWRCIDFVGSSVVAIQKRDGSRQKPNDQGLQSWARVLRWLPMRLCWLFLIEPILLVQTRCFCVDSYDVEVCSCCARSTQSYCRTRFLCWTGLLMATSSPNSWFGMIKNTTNCIINTIYSSAYSDNDGLVISR